MLSSILMNYYLSAGRTWLANLLTLCRSYELIVPCAWVLSRRMGAAGVWLSFTLAEALSWVALAAALALYRRARTELSGLLLLDRRFEESGRAIAFSVHSRKRGLDLLDSLDDSLGIAMIAAAASSVDCKTTFGVNNLTIIL